MYLGDIKIGMNYELDFTLSKFGHDDEIDSLVVLGITHPVAEVLNVDMGNHSSKFRVRVRMPVRVKDCDFTEEFLISHNLVVRETAKQVDEIVVPTDHPLLSFEVGHSFIDLEGNEMVVMCVDPDDYMSRYKVRPINEVNSLGEWIGNYEIDLKATELRGFRPKSAVLANIGGF